MEKEEQVKFLRYGKGNTITVNRSIRFENLPKSDGDIQMLIFQFFTENLPFRCNFSPKDLTPKFLSKYENS